MNAEEPEKPLDPLTPFLVGPDHTEDRTRKRGIPEIETFLTRARFWINRLAYVWCMSRGMRILSPFITESAVAIAELAELHRKTKVEYGLGMGDLPTILDEVLSAYTTCGAVVLYFLGALQQRLRARGPQWLERRRAPHHFIPS